MPSVLGLAFNKIIDCVHLSQYLHTLCAFIHNLFKYTNILGIEKKHTEEYIERVKRKVGLLQMGNSRAAPERNGVVRKVAFKLFLSCFFNRNAHRVEYV